MKRNNIVSLLMDKVPRKNREGYTPTSTMDGDFLLVELESTSEIAEFLASHSIFGEISGDDRRRMYDTLADATVEHKTPGRYPTLLMKVRLHNNGTGSLFSPFARLGLRYSRMMAIVTNGQRNAKYDRNQSSSTMTVDQFLELATDMPIVDCVCPDDIDIATWNYTTNGAFIE